MYIPKIVMDHVEESKKLRNTQGQVLSVTHVTQSYYWEDKECQNLENSRKCVMDNNRDLKYICVCVSSC